MSRRDTNTDLPDVSEGNNPEEVEERPDDADLNDDLDADTSNEGDGEGGNEADAEDGDDTPLGPKGQKALDAMKATIKDLKKSVRDLKAENADLRKGGDGEEDELTSAKKAAESEREKRIEAEKKLAAKVHGLPDSWADRLKGDDFDDFLDDAEALAADMPTPRGRKGGGGAKEGGSRQRKELSLVEKIAEAEKKGDHALVRRLKAERIHEMRSA